MRCGRREKEALTWTYVEDQNGTEKDGAVHSVHVRFAKDLFNSCTRVRGVDAKIPEEAKLGVQAVLLRQVRVHTVDVLRDLSEGETDDGVHVSAGASGE